MALRYFCTGKDKGVCDYEADSRWTGRCPLDKGGCGRYYNIKVKGNPEDKSKISLAALGVKEVKRISTGIDEVDKVLGGGMVAGSTIVISGPPGTGKSTLLVTIADRVAKGGKKVLYTSGEQSADDVGLIAQRVGALNPDVEVHGNSGDCYKMAETIEEMKPTLLIVDSCQTAFLDDVEAAEGSSAQINAVINFLTALGKREKLCLMIVSHVNKEGMIAGPRALEHLVDTLLEFDPFEGDVDEDGEQDAETKNWRVLTSGKNRNGPSGISAMFEMTDKGIVPIRKKSKLLLV
jgi:DNA repair protein RadA/Sms